MKKVVMIMLLVCGLLQQTMVLPSDEGVDDLEEKKLICDSVLGKTLLASYIICFSLASFSKRPLFGDDDLDVMVRAGASAALMVPLLFSKIRGSVKPYVVIVLLFSSYSLLTYEQYNCYFNKCNISDVSDYVCNLVRIVNRPSVNREYEDTKADLVRSFYVLGLLPLIYVVCHMCVMPRVNNSWRKMINSVFYMIFTIGVLDIVNFYTMSEPNFSC